MRLRRSALAIGVAVHVLVLIVWAAVRENGQPPAPALPPEQAGGELLIRGPDGNPAGACPLKYTDVRADIVGYVSRVSVRQTFHNPTGTKIEAVYVFPLPEDSAVDDMVMTVGDRRIV